MEECQTKKTAIQKGKYPRLQALFLLIYFPLISRSFPAKEFANH